MGSLCTSVAAACTDAHTQSRPALWMGVGMSASMRAQAKRVCFIKFLEPPAALSALLCSALLGNVLFARWNIINYMRAFCHTPLVCMRSNSICPRAAFPFVCRPHTPPLKHLSAATACVMHTLKFPRPACFSTTEAAPFGDGSSAKKKWPGTWMRLLY